MNDLREVVAKWFRDEGYLDNDLEVESLEAADSLLSLLSQHGVKFPKPQETKVATRSSFRRCRKCNDFIEFRKGDTYRSICDKCIRVRPITEGK